MKDINAFIIDDEWLIRKELKEMLSCIEGINIVGEAATVAEAIKFLEHQQPDVIFLDVEMPGELGFNLFEQSRINCHVIFITAYDKYAVKAFEVNALD